MRFSVVVGVLFVGCLPVRIAQSAPPSFPAEAVEAKAVDAGSYDRALQRLVAEGFEVVTSTPSSGLVVVERTAVDEALTAKKAERWVGGPRPPSYARRLTLTVVIGPKSATISPKVVACRVVRANVTCLAEVLPELAPSEADLVERVVAAIEPTSSIP